MTESKTVNVKYPINGLPYFAVLPYYVWGEVNYDSDGDCKFPLDKEWTYLSISNRSTKEYFNINVIQDNDDKQLKIEGDPKTLDKVCEYFSDKPDSTAMCRVNVVNYCFNHPATQIFNDMSMFGSWKWVGTLSSEFTSVGRWLMLDAMRKSNQGTYVALQWYLTTQIKAQSDILAKHLRNVCGKMFDPDIRTDLKHYAIFIQLFPEPDPCK